MRAVGARWALLIVRELLGEQKRFKELQRALVGIRASILATRLLELENSGVVRRVVRARPSAIVYELTEVGRALEPIVNALGNWGKRLS
jgi:DNA-binding HxlR family transcriptional regulator